MALPDPSDDIYKIMDRAGLDGASMYSAKESLFKIVTRVRGEIVRETKALIEQREAIIRKETDGEG